MELMFALMLLGAAGYLVWYMWDANGASGRQILFGVVTLVLVGVLFYFWAVIGPRETTTDVCTTCSGEGGNYLLVITCHDCHGLGKRTSTIKVNDYGWCFWLGLGVLIPGTFLACIESETKEET